MKKKITIIAVSFLFITASAFVIITSANKKHKGGTENQVYELLPRIASMAYTAEWAVMKNNAAVLLKKIKKDPADIKSLVTLAAMYLQEARVTGNFNYYNKAALQCIKKVLEKDPKNFEALTFKTTILLSQHRFEEGLNEANQLQQLYPYNAYVYGLLVDGNVEMGNYKAALEAADQMISTRPDSRSYSRIAYLREIHGDISGAIEAMKLAVDAGVSGDENTEWCRIQLGKLNEKVGKIKEAAMHYTIAIDNRKNYPYGLSGLARLATKNKEYTKALAFYLQADSLLPDHTFKEGIVEIYKLTGQNEKAKSMAAEILEYMKKFSGNTEIKEGQNEDHEMAHAYMGVGNYDKALEYALQEYNRRPSNIEMNETVAIVYYSKGEYAKALPYMETALKTNCKNPELLCHAGLIYAKTGDIVKAKKFLNDGLKNNPSLPFELEKESRDELKRVM